ncbi:MAG TPA: hypothetical protein EYP78_01305 [Candidatus Omnitrophica bacterium]|nr:hypothetical protein [Candidatus Omnitrophota bacterium]
MPTYEYECERCEYRFEVLQSITDEPLQKCPKCKGRIRRLIGIGAGIIVKGSSSSSVPSSCSTCSTKNCSSCK